MALKAKCIEKIRDKRNRIVEYKLIGNNKNIKQLKSDELKGLIRSGQLEVTNLTLTSDNKLIGNGSDAHLKQIGNVENLINRLKSLGYTINTFDTDCDHKCYIASSMDLIKHWFIIPDDVMYLYPKNGNIGAMPRYELHCYLSTLRGALRVVGGKSLISTQGMFCGCILKSIDLRSFDTSNVTDMSHMFYTCRVQSLDLSSLNTSNVTSMRGMFSSCRAQSLDLNSFDTSNVTAMQDMFHGCEVQSLDLRSFDTSKVTDMRHMFDNCKAQSLDLTSFNTSRVKSMNHMFYGCKAQSIDLSSFDTSKVKSMSHMFQGCEAQSLDLKSFDTSSVTEMRCMFQDCTAKSIDLSSFDISNGPGMEYMFKGCKAQINTTGLS